MAVVPSLAAMAALTLFQNPHMQPEGTTVDYSDWRSPATVIQRSWRRRGVLHRAATRINALLRAFSVRCFIMGINARNNLRGFGPGRYLQGHGDPRERRYLQSTEERALAVNRLRGGRRYLGWHRVVFQLGPANPNLVLFQVGAAP